MTFEDSDREVELGDACVRIDRRKQAIDQAVRQSPKLIDEMREVVCGYYELMDYLERAWAPKIRAEFRRIMETA